MKESDIIKFSKSNSETIYLSDKELVKALQDILGTDTFFFNSDMLLKGDFDGFNKYLKEKGFVLLFDKTAKNIDYEKLDFKVEQFLNRLYIENNNKKLYSYIINIYFPGEGVYSFYYKPSINNIENKIYNDINIFLQNIKKFLFTRVNEEYDISIFSSKPGGGKGPIDLKFVNNIDYFGKRKVA